MDWDKDFNEAFPDGVVKWEFDRHMEVCDGKV